MYINICIYIYIYIYIFVRRQIFISELYSMFHSSTDPLLYKT